MYIAGLLYSLTVKFKGILMKGNNRKSESRVTDGGLSILQTYVGLVRGKVSFAQVHFKSKQHKDQMSLELNLYLLLK